MQIVLRGHHWDKEKVTLKDLKKITSLKRFNSYNIFYDMKRER